MKISNCLISFAVIVAGAGCRSGDSHVASTPSNSRDTVPTEERSSTTNPSTEQGSGATLVTRGTTGNLDYTIENVPNPRLSATSREGDKSSAVYSSNIIAVYVQPHKAKIENRIESVK